MGTINCLITSILQNIFFYVQNMKEYRFAMTWVKNDKIVMFEWTMPLTILLAALCNCKTVFPSFLVFIIQKRTSKSSKTRSYKEYILQAWTYKQYIPLDVSRLWIFDILLQENSGNYRNLIMSEVQPDQSTVCPQWCCAQWRWLYATHSGFHSHETVGGSHLVRQKINVFIIITIWQTDHVNSREKYKINPLRDKLNQHK